MKWQPVSSLPSDRQEWPEGMFVVVEGLCVRDGEIRKCEYADHASTSLDGPIVAEEELRRIEEFGNMLRGSGQVKYWATAESNVPVAANDVSRKLNVPDVTHVTPRPQPKSDPVAKEDDVKVIGIYSYPKSGNTWMRHILSSALGGGIEDIPDLHQIPFEKARDFNGVKLYKHHGAEMVVRNHQKPLGTTHVVHIRRHPLDVFLSYLNFMSANVTNEADFKFSSVEDIVGTELLKLYFYTFVNTGHPRRNGVGGSYFMNNLYWMRRAAAEPGIVSIRYEDMMGDPEKALDFVPALLGVKPQDMSDALQRADNLTRKNGKFFWKRSSGYYAEYLSAEMIDLFWELRGAECAEIGYTRED